MTSVVFRYFVLASILAWAATSLHATPPLAPSNGTFQHTHYGTPFPSSLNPQIPATSRHTWQLTWQDNANDEETYIVLVRYGTVGPFTTFGILPANSTSHTFSISNLETHLTIPVQFKIEAWKYNGTVAESSTYSMSTTMPKPLGVTQQTFGTPIISPASRVPIPNTEPNEFYDGRIRLNWTDPNNAELGYEVQIREAKAGMVDADWFSIGNLPFNTNTITLSNLYVRRDNLTRVQFIPGKYYQFRVRGTRIATDGAVLATPTNFDATPSAIDGVPTTPQAFQMPVLSAPTLLTASPYSENQLRLVWKDNSENETGYRIEYRNWTPNTPETFVADQSFTVGENVNNVLVPLNQNAALEFRVCALYEYTPPAGTLTTIPSGYSNRSISDTKTFAPPTNLTAAPSPGLHNTIDLTWKDNSSVESGYDVLVRLASDTSGAYKFARAVRANITSVSLDSMAGTVATEDGRPTETNFVKLTPGTEYEFVVRAIGNAESIQSALSASAKATPRAGFTMPRLYHPAKVGQSFQYHLTTTPEANRTGWNATPLPPGLTFDNSTGLISGTPTTSGVYEIPLTATFAGSATANATLTLRIVGLPSQPVITTAIPDTTVGLSAATTINLASHFTDPGAEKAARVETNRGNIDIDLFATLAPEAVANFLSYVDAGDYDGVAFHRLPYLNNEIPFVLQGGSMKPSTDSQKSFTSVGRRASPMNEPGVSNVRGTISAAKLGGRPSNFVKTIQNQSYLINRGDNDSYGYLGDPNSATVDFFLNPGNNAGNLDNQNGGFTAYGRLTDSSLLVLDQICQLPRRNYEDGRTTSDTSGSLDKRILLDGESVPVSDFPVNAGAAPVDMDHTKSVKIIKARSIPVLTYTVDEVSTDKAAVTVENGQLKITGLAAGTRPVTITARDLDGNTIQHSFTINVTPGFQPPVITKHPVSATVNVKANVTLSVTATGTGLAYQWRRGGANISGKTNPTLVLTNVQAGDAGVYDVVVTGGGRSVVSSPATLAIRVPADITSSLPNELLLTVGEPLRLPLNVTGTPAPTFTWKRGTTVIKGQTSRELYIESVTLADAGLYTATAANGSSDKSNTCSVLVVDKGITRVAGAAGKPVKLTAPAAGPFVSYAWRKGGQPINKPGITGMDKPVLTIASAQAGTTGNGDGGDYTCVLTPPGSLPVTFSGIVRLIVAGPPELGTLSPPNGYVGDGYSYTIPATLSDTNQPSSFSVTGLPPGLTLNAATGVISGRPTKAGIYPLTARATNPAGTGPASSGTLRIYAPEVAGAGTYVGIVNPAQTINETKGGRLDLTVTDNSAWSAKLQLGKEIYNLKGTIVISLSSVPGASSLVYASVVNFTSKTGQPLALYFEVNPSGGDVTGIISSTTEVADVNGYRLIWSSTRNGCFYTGTYNMALTHPADQSVQPDVPQGDGYLALSVTSAGMGSIAGRLADGSTVTSSAFVGRAGQSILFQMLYKNTGSLLARMGVTSGRSANSSTAQLLINSYNGSARWIKDKQPATERNYQPGFASTVMNLRGWAYQAPKAEITPIVMNLPNMAGNVRLDFDQGGLQGASRNPDLTFRLTNANQADFTAAANPAKVTLKVVPATGAYTGTFELEDSGIKRPVTFQGLIIPAIAAIPGLPSFSLEGSLYAAQAGQPPTTSFGAGYFLLDNLPVPPSTKSVSVLSGSARLTAPSLTFTTQPASQAVNPGASVTFTCAVNGGLATPTSTLAYQWRKDGINLASATTPTLSLTNAQNVNEGKYDCVVREVTIFTLPDDDNNNATPPPQLSIDTNAVTSQVATLSVNDPVSDIVILQNPAKNVVPTGSVVTFTAEHKGTASFTYQWRRNGTDIDGATSATYTTAPVNNDNAGNYTVLVKNDLTTAGLESTAKTLAHANPVNAVVVSRTPSSTKVGIGTSVIFNAIVSGANPVYQWLKNDIPIIAATGSSFTIPTTALTDTGSYKVQVFNSVTVNAITSNPVALTMTADISNPQIVAKLASSGAALTGTAAPLNTDITLTIEVSGTGPFTYQWRKNEVDISDATSNVLPLNTGSTVNLDNPDRYDVLIKNAAVSEGVLSAPFTLRVAELVSNVVATSSPAPDGIVIGGNITMSVTASGSDLTYQWRKGETDIEGATSSSYNINSYATGHDGDYSVLVRNPVTPAGVRSNILAVKANAPVESASITLTSPTNTTVDPNQQLQFGTNVTGGYGWTYQWRLDGVEIPGANSATLTILAPETPNADPDTYDYDVRVSNAASTGVIYSNSIPITVRSNP